MALPLLVPFRLALAMPALVRSMRNEHTGPLGSSHVCLTDRHSRWSAGTGTAPTPPRPAALPDAHRRGAWGAPAAPSRPTPLRLNDGFARAPARVGERPRTAKRARGTRAVEASARSRVGVVAITVTTPNPVVEAQEVGANGAPVAYCERTWDCVFVLVLLNRKRSWLGASQDRLARSGGSLVGREPSRRAIDAHNTPPNQEGPWGNLGPFVA
jgi:hypothetical protein